MTGICFTRSASNADAIENSPVRPGLVFFAYLLMERMRSLGCQGTELERATVGSLRGRLLKVAARVRSADCIMPPTKGLTNPFP
jgi:hypothetical protein